MLACVRWTLTHSSGWAAGPAGLALGLEPVVMSASRVAETVAEGEAWDDDGEDEPACDGEPVGELDAADDGDADAGDDAGDDAEPEPEADPDGDGDVLPGLLVGSVPEDAGALGEPGELEDGDGDGDEELEDGEGDGDGDWVVGVGVGVGVAAAGSASHLVSVFASALAEVLGLAATAACIVPARAAPGQPASTPRVRDPPATRLSTAARTCAKRMKTALSPLLFEVTACSLWGS